MTKSVETVDGRSAHSADGPIDDPADDALGRKEFAHALAADVRHAPSASGFVIGLAGEWGGGKTSVLKLVAKDLRDRDVCAVVSFNPWLFSGTEQLVTHFFTELSGQLEETGTEQLGKVARAFSAYGRVVSPLRYVPYVGEVIKLTSDAAKNIGESLEVEAPSAQVQAEQLKAQLIQLERPILVLVDDLDRLRPEEIVDVVRLVRLVGDFPNLVYLVAFDRTVVEKALDANSDGEGRAYLEKIIHIHHALPSIRHEDLTVVLRDALEEAIPRPSDYRYDEQRLNSLFWSDTRPLFATIRDVRRFVNVLRTTLELLGDEVDLADILALEALRLFEPDAFDALVASRYTLTGSIPPFGGIDYIVNSFSQEVDPAEREQVTGIPELGTRPKDVERILKQLFPTAEHHFGGSSYSRNSLPTWKAARRVVDGEVFDVYLHRRLAPGVLPSREVEQVLSLFKEETAFSQTLAEMDDAALRNLYTRLADYQGEFPSDGVRNALEVVMRRGVGFSDSFSDMSGSTLVRRLLDVVPSDQLASLIRELDYPNLSRRYELVRAVSYLDDSGRGMVSKEEAAALEGALVVDMLSTDAQDLAAEPDLAPLVGLAIRRNREGLLERLPDWLLDNDFFVRFLAAHMFSKVAAGNRRFVQLNWPGLLDLIDEVEIQDRLDKIDPSWVEQNFDEDTWVLWQQALRYRDHPEEAEQDLRSWPTGQD